MERETERELSQELTLEILRTVAEMTGIAHRAVRQFRADKAHSGRQFRADEAHSRAGFELAAITTTALEIANAAWERQR